jgi:protoporphyrinogen oxidase
MNSSTLDVAIVGAGPAGLRIAHKLQASGASIRVFESLNEVGGRTASADIDGVRINTGAMFVYRGTHTDKLCHELGITYEPVEPQTFSVHLHGKTALGKQSADFSEMLPVSDTAKQDIRGLVEKLSATYAKHGADLVGADHLAGITLADFIGPIGDEARDFLWAAVAGACTGTPDELNVKFGLRYFASFLVRDPASRGYVPEGMQSIFTALYGKVAGLVSLNTTVNAISGRPDGSWDLRFTTKGVEETVNAKHVVMAVPGPLVEELVTDLPAWKKEAIAAIPTPSQMTLGAVVDCTDRPHWADIFYTVSIGTKFQGVTQPRTGPDFASVAKNRTYFCMFRGRDTAEELHAEPDAVVIDAWLEDFYKVFPDARGRVKGTYLKRWDAAFAYPRFDRAVYLPDVRKPVGTMHFAGDYTSETAGSHGALSEGERVAADLQAELVK